MDPRKPNRSCIILNCEIVNAKTFKAGSRQFYALSSKQADRQICYDIAGVGKKDQISIEKNLSKYACALNIFRKVVVTFQPSWLLENREMKLSVTKCTKSNGKVLQFVIPEFFTLEYGRFY